MSKPPKTTCLDVAEKLLGQGKKQGKERLFTCPNHQDEHPSLSINPEKDVWICRPCNQGGAWWALANWIDPKEQPDKPKTLWDEHLDFYEFCKSAGNELEWLMPPYLARGLVTMLTAKRGIGKSNLAASWVVELAKQGKKVRVIDRDQNESEISRKLMRYVGTETDPNKLPDRGDMSTLWIATRDNAPKVTDKHKWKDFPHDTDLLVIDGWDRNAEGIGEQDSAKATMAIATLLDVCRKTQSEDSEGKKRGGAAVLVIHNTIKSGAYGRGSGVLSDAADIHIEARDATSFIPSGKGEHWVDELPAQGVGDYQDSSNRRADQETFRLALLTSKYKVAKEIGNKIFELHLPDEGQWGCRDVTDEVVQSGKRAHEEKRQASIDKENKILSKLVEKIRTMADKGNPMKKDKDGVEFLTSRGITVARAR